MRQLFRSLLIISFVGSILTKNCENNEDYCSIPTTEIPLDQDKNWESATSIYDFHVKDILGNDIKLDKYRGHVVVIVNVASQCGLTESNYKQLVQLHAKYGKSKGLEILAFPSNQFGGQEPGTNKEILEFGKQYKVQFDMFDKIDVNGENAHPLWKWLKTQKYGYGYITNEIKWNFTKFIIDKEGQVVARFAPNDEPLTMETTLEKYF